MDGSKIAPKEVGKELDKGKPVSMKFKTLDDNIINLDSDDLILFRFKQQH